MNMEQMGSVQAERHAAKNPESSMREGIDMPNDEMEQRSAEKKVLREEGLLKMELKKSEIDKIQKQIEAGGPMVATYEKIKALMQAEYDALADGILSAEEDLDKSTKQ